MNILLLNGPNLNLLGEREPEIYGKTTLAEIELDVQEACDKVGDSLRTFQSNHEGALIDKIQSERAWADALIFNPGAFTHYSYALRDAIAGWKKLTVEVHLSDLNKREEFRRHSVFEGLANVRRIMGKGPAGYLEAHALLHSILDSGNH